MGELAFLGRIAPLADSYDTERPGRDPHRNYDLHFNFEGYELHVEMKHRRIRPLGMPPPALHDDISDIVERSGIGGVSISFRTSKVPKSCYADIIACVSECIYWMLGRRDTVAELERSHVDSRSFPDRLKSSAGLLLYGGQSPLLFYVIGKYNAIGDPGKEKVVVDHEIVDTIQKISWRRGAVVIGYPESRVMERIAPRASKVDVAIPEWKDIADLLESVPMQLPDGPHNVAVMSTYSAHHAVHLELALYGSDRVARQRGEQGLPIGLFNEDRWRSVGSVLLLTFTDVGGQAPMELGLKCYPNPNAYFPMVDLDHVVAAVSGHA